MGEGQRSCPFRITPRRVVIHGADDKSKRTESRIPSPSLSICLQHFEVIGCQPNSALKNLKERGRREGKEGRKDRPTAA